jgi:hypothetical protein
MGQGANTRCKERGDTHQGLLQPFPSAKHLAWWLRENAGFSIPLLFIHPN